MRRITLVALAPLLAAGPALAPPVLAAGPFTLLGSATATGPGTPVATPVAYTRWTCQVNVSGAPSEVVVNLEGNVTGVTYTKMASWTLSTDTAYASGQGIFSVADMPALNVRGNLVTLTGGTAPTVTMICTGVE